MTGETVRAHARLAPSSAHRWLACPPSARMEAEAVKLDPSLNASGYASLRGTAGHAVAEHWIENPSLPHGEATNEVWSELLEQIGDGDLKHVSKGDRKGVIAGALRFRAECLSLVSSGGATKHWVEKRFKMPRIHESIFGTADFSLMDYRRGRAVLRDLKMGRHIVEAEGNRQLLVYAEGLREQVKKTSGVEPAEYDLGIVQPVRGDQPLVNTIISAHELDLFVEQAAETAERAFHGQGDLNPGAEQCRWCRAQASCPARFAEMEKEAQALFADTPEPIGVEIVPSEQLAAFIERTRTLSDYAEKLRGEARVRLVGGEEIEGMKLVRKQTQWKGDGERIRLLFGGDGFTDRPLSRSDLLADGHDPDLVALCFSKAEGDLVAATAGDRRRAVEAE